MKPIFNTFIILLVFVFAVLCGFSLVVLNQDVCNAQNFFESAKEKIECSNFEEGTMKAAIKAASERGYKLSIINKSQNYEYEKIPCYYLQLEYKVDASILGIHEESVITGFAK